MPSAPPRHRASSVLVALAGLAASVSLACQGPGDAGQAPPSTAPAAGRTIDQPSPALTAPPASGVPRADEPVDEPVAAAVDLIVAAGREGPGAPEIDRLALSGDVRQGWILLDALTTLAAKAEPRQHELIRGLATLTGQSLPGGEEPAVFYGDLLLAWDVPAPPGYAEDKAALLTEDAPPLAAVVDPAAAVDWRTVRPTGDGPDAGPALDEPEAVPGADEGGWLDDDEVVFGVVVGGHARAYPARVLAVHEVVNDVVGGRPVAITWCRLCQGAVAHDRALDATGALLTPDGAPLELAATGLLEGAAPLLYERRTGALLRSLSGEPVTGPLAHGDRRLAPLTVRTATWGAWLAAFPDTSVVSDDAGIGRVYLRDQGSAGPARAVAVGRVDDRLGPAVAVLGVERPGAAPVAFPAEDVRARLAAGEVVEHEDVRVVADGGGLTAVAGDGTPLVACQLNWMAWSGAHPGTRVWSP